MPENREEGDLQGGYAVQLDALRSVAKWLVAAFAGIGALLVAGLSISGIGQLSPSSWRLYTAAGSAAVALAAVALMIREASTVLTHEWLTLADLSDPGPAVPPPKADWKSAELREIHNLLDVSKHELFGYVAESPPKLQERLQEVDRQLRRARPGSRRALRAAREAAALRKAARATAQYANYRYTLKLFQRMRTRIAWAALVTAISVGVFAYAANPPKSVAQAREGLISIQHCQLNAGKPKEFGGDRIPNVLHADPGASSRNP